MDQTNNQPPCRGALSHSTPRRRTFLRQAFGCVSAMVTVGLAKSELPVLGAARLIAAQGGERRYDLPATDGVVVDAGASVLLARYQGKVFAMSMACPHQRAAVRWSAKDNRFQCSKHDSKYQPDGTYTSGRATRNLDRFPIRRVGDSVGVDVTRVFRSDQDSSAWAAAAVSI